MRSVFYYVLCRFWFSNRIFVFLPMNFTVSLSFLDVLQVPTTLYFINHARSMCNFVIKGNNELMFLVHHKNISVILAPVKFLILSINVITPCSFLCQQGNLNKTLLRSSNTQYNYLVFILLFKITNCWFNKTNWISSFKVFLCYDRNFGIKIRSNFKDFM